MSPGDVWFIIMNNIWAVIPPPPRRNFSSPLLSYPFTLLFSPYIVCRNHLAPVINRGLKSWRLSLINQALLSWGIVGKVSDSCFVFRHSKISLALKKHLRGRQPVEIEFLLSGRKNAKKKQKKKTFSWSFVLAWAVSGSVPAFILCDMYSVTAWWFAVPWRWSVYFALFTSLPDVPITIAQVDSSDREKLSYPLTHSLQRADNSHACTITLTCTVASNVEGTFETQMAGALRISRTYAPTLTRRLFQAPTLIDFSGWGLSFTAEKQIERFADWRWAQTCASACLNPREP